MTKVVDILDVPKWEKGDMKVNQIYYEIDFDKVNGIEDVIKILKAMNLAITLGEQTENIKHLLKIVEK